MGVFGCRQAAIALAVFTLGLSTAAHAVDVAGTQVNLGWTAASGPVSGYYVIVARDGGTAKVESVTVATSKTLTGTVGETLVVQVAAFAQDGVAGPVSPSSSPITFVSSTGGGTTTPPPSGGGTTPPPSGGGGTTTPPPSGGTLAVARDFTGDGISDLVVVTGSTVKLWAMNGGSVTSEIALPTAPTQSRVVGTGDYDGNGTADLLWENTQTGDLTLWLLNASAVLATGTLDRSSLPAGEEWHVGGSADFNGDGRDDLMLFSRVKGETEVWNFSGTSVATRTRIAGHKGAWSVVAVADTDGDGKAEMVWLDEFNRTLELRDPAAPAPVALGSLSPGFRGRGGVDLTGDGSAEIVVSDTSTGAAQDYALDDSGILGSANLPSASGLGRFAGGGDFDGNGGEDIAWSNVFNGKVTLWLSTSGAPTPLVVNRALPAGGDVVSGNTASDDSAFRQRFCSGDLDGNGYVTSNDFKLFRKCLNKPRSLACNLADMDSDGMVTNADYQIFKLRFTGTTCEAW
jgi:hypothetical protein